MNWLFLMLLSTALFAVGNIFDKIVISKYVNLKNLHGYLGVLFLSHFFIVLAVLPFADISSISMNAYALITLRTMVLLLGIYCSAVLMLREEISRIISIAFTNILIAFLLDYLIFGTKLSFYGYLGALILISSTILMTYKPNKKMFMHKEDIFYLSVMLFGWGLYAIIIKGITKHLEPATFLLFDAINIFIVGIIFLAVSKSAREKVKRFIKVSRVFWALFFPMLAVYLTATIFYFMAFSLQSVSVLVPFETLQPTLVFFFALFLSRYFPMYIKEEIDRKTIAYKIIALGLLTLGVYLMITYAA